MFWGVLNSVLIGTLVYLSDGIDTLSVGIICCFILVSNRPKTMSHISSKKKNTPHSPPPPPHHFKELDCLSVSCLKYCIQIYLPVYTITNALFSPWNFTLEIGMRIICTPERFLFIYEVICITRQNYEVEQLPILPVLWNMENKLRQNVCQTSCITSEFSRCITISHSTGISQVYDHDRKSVAFFRIFL